MKTNKTFIQQVLRLARDMIILADEGQSVARDDGCRLLCGVVQDCAYKIRLDAEREKEAHRGAGKWNDNAPRTVKGSRSLSDLGDNLLQNR